MVSGEAHSHFPLFPLQAGTLLVVGMGAFCGSLYHQALTENPVLRKLAPYGGMFLIAGWLAIAI